MSRLGGRFVLGERIGAGGMSEVFLGTDEVLDRRVAVKVLRGGFEGSDVGARFSREGRTAARLSHPNIVQVYDAGEDELDGREVSYIVMEYVSGGDLKGMMDERGTVDEAEVSRIMADVASGLEHAHERGIVHRDIKPHNILIDAYGHPKLTDFGIAKALDATTSTQTGLYLGTALYSSPEQLKGEAATPKSDVYALGATLYHAVLGSPPFKGGPIEVAGQQISRPVTPPRARGAEIGARLDRLIMRCLSKDPALRPETSELRSELLSISAADASQGTAVASTQPSISEAVAPVVENVQAAGAAAIAGMARAARNASEKGAAGIEAAAQGIKARLGSDEGAAASPAAPADPTRTVTFPTRTFRPGHERQTTLIGAAVVALILLFLMVWGIFALLSGPETAQTNDGLTDAQQPSGENGAGASGSGSDGTDEPDGTGDERPKKEQKEEQPSGPTPPEEQAANVVYEMYLDSVGDDDYGASWDMLSSRLKDEIGSQEQWAKRQSSLTSFSITGEELQTDRVEGGKAYVYGDVQTNRSGGSKNLTGPWILVPEGGEWKVDELPDQ